MEGTPQQPRQPPAQPSVPAGWYPDPNGQGQRYWDGAAWTEHTAPTAEGVAAVSATGAATPATGGGPSTVDWALAIILPLLLPLAGLIWGGYLIYKKGGREKAGNVAVVLSLVVILIVVLATR